MDIYRVEITKKMLEKMPKAERVLFILLGTMLNEINMLHKVTYLFNKDGVSQVEHKAQIAQSLFFQTLLAGKLWECWKALKANFFHPKMKKYEQKLNEAGRHSLQQMKKYFGRNRWMSNVRNWVSFHYDRQHIIDQLERMPENEVLEIFLSEAQGNTLYFGSSIFSTMGIAATIDAADPNKGFSTYLSETLEVAGNVLIFLNALVSAIAEENLDLQLQEQKISEPPSIDEIHLPFFVKRP